MLKRSHNCNKYTGITIQFIEDVRNENITSRDRKQIFVTEDTAQAEMFVNINTKGYFSMIISNEYFSTNYTSANISTGPEIKSNCYSTIFYLISFFFPRFYSILGSYCYCNCFISYFYMSINISAAEKVI